MLTSKFPTVRDTIKESVLMAALAMAMKALILRPHSPHNYVKMLLVTAKPVKEDNITIFQRNLST